MKGLAYFLGIASGFGLTLQIGMNTKLSTVMHSPNTAALISFMAGTVGLVALLVVTRTPLPDRDTLASIPMWAWFGGFMGAFYVAISTVVASQLGAVSLLALALLGQLATAMVADHFGWVGLPVHPITFARLAGVALLGTGVWLITRS